MGVPFFRVVSQKGKTLIPDKKNHKANWDPYWVIEDAKAKVPVVRSAHASRLPHELRQIQDVGGDMVVVDTAPHADSAAPVVGTAYSYDLSNRVLVDTAPAPEILGAHYRATCESGKGCDEWLYDNFLETLVYGVQAPNIVTVLEFGHVAV